MDPMANKYSFWKRLVHKFQARRDVPFRRKFFVGYDLHGNTYWEFSIDGNMRRLRRKLQPYKESLFTADYFETVPPQWLQWLRRTKKDPPSLQELIDDQIRQQRIKLLAKQADEKWSLEKQRLEHEQRLKLEAELQRVREENEKFEKEQAQELKRNQEKEQLQHRPDTKQGDPWAQADASAGENPIQSASIKPRK